ncbi:MAG: kynureninase [Ardenticatenaceae bacterium]|nr:kynureninase [Ardenticatenaceae bacterium]
MNFSPDLDYARALDAQDELADFRQRFVIDDPDLIYLDGNSLGRLPQASRQRLHQLIDEEWGQGLIRGWNGGWFTAPERIGDKMAQIVGASEGEVIMADSTSVNLFKLALAAVLAQPSRHKIITDDLNFPSDLYILQGIQQITGRPLSIQVIKSEDGIHGPAVAIAAAIDSDTALVTLTHTVFKSGYVYDMAAINAAAHEAGALTLWDLSHSVGSVIVELNQANSDLAVGCSYKYVNGGPGAPAFLYVRRDLQDKLGNPISGWMGKKDMFDFALDYEPAAGIRQFMTGTYPMLSLTAVEPGVDVLLEAGMDRLRAKSVQQTEYLIALWESELKPFGFTLNTPRDAQWRGSHVSIGHEDGLRIDLALINDVKVLPDFRPPNNIRLGITPLYTSFEEIWTAVHRIRRVMTEKLYEKYDPTGLVVT